VARELEDPFLHYPNEAPLVHYQNMFNRRLLVSWESLETGPSVCGVVGDLEPAKKVLEKLEEAAAAKTPVGLPRVSFEFTSHKETDGTLIAAKPKVRSTKRRLRQTVQAVS
jgi:hypothetical protein